MDFLLKHEKYIIKLYIVQVFKLGQVTCLGRRVDLVCLTRHAGPTRSSRRRPGPT